MTIPYVTYYCFDKLFTERSELLLENFFLQIHSIRTSIQFLSSLSRIIGSSELREKFAKIEKSREMKEKRRKREKIKREKSITEPREILYLRSWSVISFLKRKAKITKRMRRFSFFLFFFFSFIEENVVHEVTKLVIQIARLNFFISYTYNPKKKKIKKDLNRREREKKRKKSGISLG